MSVTRRAVQPLLFLLLLHLLVVLAGFVAPYDATSQFRELPFAPPSRVHLFDRSGGLHLRPFIYPWKNYGGFADYKEDTDHAARLAFFVTGDSYPILLVFRSSVHLFGVDQPARIVLLGTDGFGRDQFSRFLYGGQISLFAGLLAAGLSIGLGLLLGSAAGYHGGLLDAMLMRTTEVLIALPWLYLLLALRGFLPLNMDPAPTFLVLIVVIGVLGWGRLARLVRGIVLSAKERNYVVAARGFGATECYLLRRHVLPQTRGVILTQAAILIPQYILAEVTLSFLGLGVAEPVASWGNLLSPLQEYSVLTSYWWMILPGFLLVPVFLSYYALARSFEVQVESSPY